MIAGDLMVAAAPCPRPAISDENDAAQTPSHEETYRLAAFVRPLPDEAPQDAERCLPHPLHRRGVCVCVCVRVCIRSALQGEP